MSLMLFIRYVLNVDMCTIILSNLKLQNILIRLSKLSRKCHLKIQNSIKIDQKPKCKARGWRKEFTLLHYYELRLEGKMLYLKCSGCSTKTKFF